MSALRAAWIVARQGVRARRRRVLLTAVGIALASAMLAAAVVISYGLGTGFDRAARAASLPDIIVRFNDKSARTVAQRITALPDVARYALRLEVTNVGIDLDRRREFRGRRGRGGDRSRSSPRVRDRGRARPAQHRLRAARRARVRACVGGPSRRQDGRARARADARRRVRRGARQRRLSRSPSHVSTSRVPRSAARFGPERNPEVNLAEIWLRDPKYLDEVLVQARATSYGLRSITFATTARASGSCSTRPPGS